MEGSASWRVIHFFAVTVGMLSVACFPMGCEALGDGELGLDVADQVPSQTLNCRTESSYGGTGGSFVYRVTLGDRTNTIDVWSWVEGALVPRHVAFSIPEETFDTVWFESRYVYVPFRGEGDNYILCRDIATAKVIKQWPLTRDWYCPKIRASRNGRHVAIDVSPSTMKVLGAGERLGLIGPEMGEITWLPPLEAPDLDGDPRLSTLIPSDDGAYVAVAGWKNGAGVYDVRANRLLWYARPKEEAALDDIAFSPDNKRVYTGGVNGCIYVMETATGKILDRWHTTMSGEAVYGHRIVTVAASPDGRFVAAGTGPVGLAYVWRASTGKRIKVLNHGGSTILILSFSPDSKSLATYAKGEIKVWRMPED